MFEYRFDKVKEVVTERISDYLLRVMKRASQGSMAEFVLKPLGEVG